MTNVDFYIIQSQQPDYQWLTLRDVFVCQLIEKVWKKGHKIYLHTDNASEAQKLDNLLWTFRQGSFIPHGLSHQASEPVCIGCDAWTYNNTADVLINIASTLPTNFVNFPRILEILNDTPHIKQAGREHYRRYQQQGYALSSHKIQR